MSRKINGNNLIIWTITGILFFTAIFYFFFTKPKDEKFSEVESKNIVDIREDSNLYPYYEMIHRKDSESDGYFALNEYLHKNFFIREENVAIYGIDGKDVLIEDYITAIQDIGEITMVYLVTYNPEQAMDREYEFLREMDSVYPFGVTRVSHKKLPHAVNHIASARYAIIEETQSPLAAFILGLCRFRLVSLIKPDTVGVYNKSVNKGRIPKVVCVTVSNKEKGFDLERRHWDSFRENYPDFEVKIMDNEEQREFIEKYFPKVSFYYDAISESYGAARADLFRYCWMYKNGGYYIDKKSCMNMGLIQDEDEFVYFQALYYYSLPQRIPAEAVISTMVAVPEHPIFKKVIEEACQRIKNYTYIPSDSNTYGLFGTLNTTGPFMYSKVIHENINKYKHRTLRGDNFTEVDGWKNFAGSDMNRLCIPGWENLRADRKTNYTQRNTPIIDSEKQRLLPSDEF